MEVLDKNNYETWTIQMKALMIKNDSWKYIIETGPEGDDANVKQEWEAGDQKAMADLILNIQPTELKQIKKCGSAKEIWLKLSEIFKSTGPARKATLLKALLHLKMMENESDVRNHLREFFDLVDKLQDLDIHIDDELLTIMLLYSLPQHFENFRIAIESRDDLPKPDVLKIKIIEEFNARRNGSPNDDSSAYFANVTRNRRFYPRSKFKRSTRWKEDRRTTNRGVTCWSCKEPGHTRNKCPNITPKQTPRSFHLESNSIESEKEEEAGLFILDSGSTGHFLKDKVLFKSLKESPMKNLKLADESSTKIEGTGNAVITTKKNSRYEEITIKDAMFVPSVRNNLLSIAKICDNGWTVTFSKTKVTLKSSENEIVYGKRRNNLYSLEVSGRNRKRSSERNFDPDERVTRESIAVASSSLDTRSKADFLKLHSRFGHVSAEDLARGVKSDAFKDLKKLPPIPKNFDCEVCIKGKLCQASFPNSHVRSEEKLEVIHTDLCGPIQTKSNGGASYFVTFIDECTDWTEVRFLKHKSDTLEVFKEVQKLLERQSGKRIKFIQSDRGTEYLGGNFNNYLKDLGISRRLSVKHTPQQNGRAERKNRTLLDIARCMLIESGLPIRFWAEAIATANHIKNRTPSKLLGGKTPYSIWFGRDPNVGYFKTFGCDAYAWNNFKPKRKFDHRGLKGIFVGYHEQSKGFRIYLKDKNIIEVTRSVKFMEDKNLVQNREYLEFDPYGEDVLEHDKNTQTFIVPFPDENKGDPPSDLSSESEVDVPDDSGKVKRAPGRPKRVKTGKRGRPKKVYQTAPTQSSSDDICDDTIGEPSSNLGDANECMIGIESISLEDAIRSEDTSLWIKALASECRSIIKNDTFDLVDTPVDIESVSNIVGSRFTLRNKSNSSGNEIKKARLIAQGFSQVADVNYYQNQTYSPVARLSSIRLLATLASKLKLKIHQFDITTAYLNGILDETVLMRLPKYFDIGLNYLIENDPDKALCAKAEKMLQDISRGNKICSLKKSLYGLKQSGRCWYLKLKEILLNFGFKNTVSDPCIFHMKENNLMSVLTVYVDDLLLISEDSEIVTKLLNHFSTTLEVKYSGEANHCLGIEFQNVDGLITLSQQKYVTELLEKFHMSDCNPVKTPMEVSIKFVKAETPDESLPYRELIGSLNYLSVSTRPDISFCISKLSQYLTCYDKSHWTAAKRVLRYLKGTVNYRLVYKCDDSNTVGFTDSDWGNSTDDRRSYSGFIFKVCNGTISWEAKKQKTVALSSTEAEYMSLSHGIKEALYLQKLLRELDLIELSNIKIFIDNNGALKLAESNLHHSRTKHIDIQHHFIKDVLKDNEFINLDKISTDDMCADIFTKALPAPKHYKCIAMMNLEDFS